MITPGKWEKKGNKIEAWGHGTIAIIPMPSMGGVFECQANQDLIASAPTLKAQNEKMLAALKGILVIETNADGLRGSGMVDDVDIKALRAMANKAREAISEVEAGK